MKPVGQSRTGADWENGTSEEKKKEEISRLSEQRNARRGVFATQTIL